MTPDPEVAEALERLDPALTPPRILAAKAVAEFRGRELPQPWVNVVDSGAPLLNRDATVRASYPNYAPVVQRRRQSLLRRLCWWR